MRPAQHRGSARIRAPTAPCTLAPSSVVTTNPDIRKDANALANSRQTDLRSNLPADSDLRTRWDDRLPSVTALGRRSKDMHRSGSRRRAPGVRIDSSHDGNPSADFETLYLFDFSRSRTPEILNMPISWGSGETGTGTACISDDWHRTIAVERSMTHGYFDLRVTEKSSFTKSFTENELPGEACVCRYGHESRRRIIRFDGARYPTPPNPPDPPDAIDESNPTSQRGE